MGWCDVAAWALAFPGFRGVAGRQLLGHSNTEDRSGRLPDVLLACAFLRGNCTPQGTVFSSPNTRLH